MNSMPNAIDDRLEFEADQLDELYEELETENPFFEFEFEEEDEWNEEISRNSREYIRWVQNSLNKILRLKLKVDGLMGAQTRSAIRNFQQRKRLLVNGIVDPKTETAIKAALGSKPTLSVQSSNIPAYTQCDFIHDNIDVAAQYALYGMLKADPESRKASVQMLAAVKTGLLGGIYQEDQKVPALRAVQLGLGWYGPLIDSYRKSASSAACVPPAPHPSHKLPIISFRKSLAKNHAELGRQLLQVWGDCGIQKDKLPTIDPRGGDCSLPPPPKPQEITVSQGTIIAQVTFSDGRPAQGVDVWLYDHPPYTVNKGHKKTNGTGRAVFSGLGLGTYKVVATANLYQGETKFVHLYYGKGALAKLTIRRIGNQGSKCPWADSIDWNEKFERYYNQACQMMWAIKGFCNVGSGASVPSSILLGIYQLFGVNYTLPDICRMSQGELEQRVDDDVCNSVYAEIVRETGIVGGMGPNECGPQILVRRKYFSWKQSRGKKCIK